MPTRMLVAKGDRWIVKQGARVSPAHVSSGYVSETPAKYEFVFVNAATGRKRRAEWHNPLDMCDIEDLQIMFADAR